MTANVPVVHTIEALRARVAAWRANGEHIGLVPTMGALHAGHLSLVEAARRDAQRVVVTVFVNPAQFGPSRGFHQISAHAAGRPREARKRGGGFVLRAGRRGDVSAWLRDPRRDGRARAGRSRRPLPSNAFFRRRHGGRQAAEPGRRRCRFIRREGLSATSGHPPAGARSRHRDANTLRADFARDGRSRHVLAQRLSLRGRAPGGAGAVSGDARGRPAHRRGRSDRSLVSKSREKASAKRGSRSIISRRGRPRRWRASPAGAKGRSGCWRRRGSARRGLSTIWRCERDQSKFRKS